MGSQALRAGGAGSAGRKVLGQALGSQQSADASLPLGCFGFGHPPTVDENHRAHPMLKALGGVQVKI